MVRLVTLPRDCPADWPSSTEQSIVIVRGLQDVTVMEPAPAWFECETSIPSVRPPKWLLGKTALQAGADVGIEQEGTVHRLTLRRTYSTMTGPVHFTIGKSRSTASLVVSGERALPNGLAEGGQGLGGQGFWPRGLAHFMPASLFAPATDIPVVLTRPLEPKVGREMQSVILSCDFKPPPKAVQWYKEDTPLAPSSKFKMRLEGHMAELRVLRLTPEDAGVYRCQAGSAQSSAEVTVEGREGRGPQRVSRRSLWKVERGVGPRGSLGGHCGRQRGGVGPSGSLEEAAAAVRLKLPHAPGRTEGDGDTATGGRGGPGGGPCLLLLRAVPRR